MIFNTYEEELNYKFYEEWTNFWIPIYRKQILNAKIENDKIALQEIKLNILKNQSLKDYTELIFEQLGIKYLDFKNEEKKKEDLFLRNQKLIYLVLKRKGLLNKQDELYDIGLIGLTNAINTFDASKGYKESTYFYQCISNEINKHIYLQSMSKRKCPTSLLSLDYELSEDTTYADFIRDPNIDIEKELITKEENKKLYCAINNLKPDYKKIIKEIYGIGTNPKKIIEIAKESKVSRNAINDKRLRALKHLKKLLKEEQYETTKI